MVTVTSLVPLLKSTLLIVIPLELSTGIIVGLKLFKVLLFLKIVTSVSPNS